MSLISPIQVVALRYLPDKTDTGKTGLAIGLSHQVKNFANLEISFVDREGNPVAFEVASAVRERPTLSNTWQLSFDSAQVASDRNSFTLKISQRQSDTTAEEASQPVACTAEGHSLFRKFLVHIDVNRNAETDQMHPVYELAEP